MQGSAYGASLAGGAFECETFIRRPQTILRFLSWIFAIVVFATITAEGYINTNVETEQKCVFNDNNSACSFGVCIGVLAFLASFTFLVLDAYFPQMSNANDRKYTVIGDLAFSGPWTILWFICFCVLANQWAKTSDPKVDHPDAARAVVAFSFFSIITWALLTYFAYARYREGVSEFNQDYRDPASDRTTSYPHAPYDSGPAGYQQSPFSNSQQNTGEYQPPTY